MTPTEYIELTRAYVALSNAHRTDLIEPLFAEQAIYRSSAVGEHRGRDAIAAMMRGFFERFPDVCWQCENYQLSNSRVGFDFTLTATDAQSGETLQRSGYEYLEFDANGLIRRLQVEAGKTGADPG